MNSNLSPYLSLNFYIYSAETILRGDHQQRSPLTPKKRETIKFESNSRDEKNYEDTFSTEKLKKCMTSNCYSPSFESAKHSSLLVNAEKILLDIHITSFKSGLRYLNVFEVISKLKFLASKGITQITLDLFIEFILKIFQYKQLPSHHVDIMKKYLEILYNIVDTKRIILY